ncbi:MAG: hypothetical protein ACI4XQ_04145, partial [Eubacteriales bacterium]
MRLGSAIQYISTSCSGKAIRWRPANTGKRTEEETDRKAYKEIYIPENKPKPVEFAARPRERRAVRLTNEKEKCRK